MKHYRRERDGWFESVLPDRKQDGRPGRRNDRDIDDDVLPAHEGGWGGQLPSKRALQLKSYESAAR